MNYREISPSSALAPYVQCYWTLRGSGSESPQASRVFPDGCMEIIFHFAETFSRVHDDGSAERQADMLLAGQIWAPVTLRPSGCADVLGVRFHPAGAAPFLRFPLQEAAGQILSLEDVWGRRAREWRDAVGGAGDRIAALERKLLECRPQPLPLPLPATLSAHQYRRRFQEQVGLTPKLFSRIRRFQKALAMLETAPFAETAAACGYVDQSHMIRDFRQFTGETPSAWRHGGGSVLLPVARAR